MDREQAREYIKGQLDDYLQSKGINTRKPFCCLNPEHNDRHPSMSYDRKRGKAHCFSCGADYDTFDIIGIDFGLTDPAKIFSKAHELFNITIDGNGVSGPLSAQPVVAPPVQATQQAHDTQEAQYMAEYLIKAHQAVGQTDYFNKRGIGPDLIERFNLGYDPHFKTKEGDEYKTWHAVIIPTGPGSFNARNTKPDAAKENRLRKRGASVIYNIPALYSGKPVFVVEGEMDALSVMDAGAEAIALGSTANTEQLLKRIRLQAPTHTLILSLDNDQDGQQAAEKLKTGLSSLGVSFIEENISAQFKDPNEHLTVNRSSFIQAVQEAQAVVITQEEADLAAEREEYLRNSAANHINAFVGGIAESVNTPAIPTGFAGMDIILDGGLYEGLYVMGAISSLGKTTFFMQLADQIAQQDQDVLVFSLEMARAEIMAKSISRLTLLNTVQSGGDPHNAKTARNITTGKKYATYTQIERDLIKDSIRDYGKYADRIFISEGIGDIGADSIRKTVQKHVFFTGRRPVIIVDYLQLLAPHDPRSTDKQNTDKSVLELKRISRDFKIPVLAISSFNRMNYNHAVTMESFKESGAIEYSSDVLIGLQAKGAGKKVNGKEFDINAAKRKNPREVELVILKNRNGRTGDTLAYEYYPLFNYFKEE